MDGITLMADIPANYRTYKNAQWSQIAFSLTGVSATVVGATASPAISHFSPLEKKYNDWIARGLSSILDEVTLIYYALARKKD